MRLIKSEDLGRAENLWCDVCKQPITSHSGVYWFDFGKKAAHVEHLEEELEKLDSSPVLLS